MSVDFYENYCKSNQINCDQNIVDALAKSLATHEVCMAGITINAQNCEALGATLYASGDIHRLNLSNSLLPVPGLSSLLEKLSDCHLSVLNLKGNNISGNATLMLSRLLMKNTSIKVLSLEWNNVGVPLPMFSKFCNALINNHTIEILDLKNNELNVECAIELADVILHNTSLKDIDLRWNCIGVEGGQNLLKALNSNTVMNVLRIQGNGIPTDIMSAIDNTVKHNSTVQKINDEYAARQDLLTRQIKIINQKRIEDFKTVCEQGVQQLQPCLDKIKEYSIERRRLIEDIEQSNIKILQLEELVTGLSAQIDGANKQIEFKQTIIFEQEKKIDEIRNQYETDLEVLKSKFAEEESKLKSEIQGFQAVIEKERDSRFLLEKQLRDSQLSVETLIRETEDLKERVSNVTSIHNKVIEEERTINKDNLDRLLEEMKSQQAQGNERFEKLKLESRDKIEMLENKLLEAEKDKQNLNEVLLNERRKWIEEKSSIFAEASQKQAEILKSIDEQVDQVKDEKTKVEQELRETKSLVKTLLHENEVIKSEFSQCSSNLTLLQNQLSESKSAFENLQREHSKISKLDETFKEEADKYKSELIRAHRMITDLQMDNNNLADKHRKEVSELSSKLQDKIEEVSRMRAEEIERAQGLYAAIHKYVGGKC